VDGIRTGDLSGTADCKSYTLGLIARIRNS
jgi:hypothetical protein